MNTEDEKRLMEIEARKEAATPGPWVVETGGYSGRDWLLGSSSEDGETYSVHLTTDHIHASQLYGDAKTDAAFIAHAREDIPWMLGLVADMRQEIERLNKAIKDGGA